MVVSLKFFPLFFQDHFNVLHVAAMYSREDVVKLLLNKRGVDPYSTGGVSIFGSKSIFIVWFNTTMEQANITKQSTRRAPNRVDGVFFLLFCSMNSKNSHAIHWLHRGNYINKNTKRRTMLSSCCCIAWQMNKVENNQRFANFYHSNTLIFIRRNVIYVFTFHNPFLVDYFRYICASWSHLCLCSFACMLFSM